MPMDVDFMVSDTLEVCLILPAVAKRHLIFRQQMLRPKMTPFKTFQEAAEATDEMLAAAAQMGELCDHVFSMAR